MIIGRNIIKEFGNPPQRILHDINLKINDGEFVSISGRSGSGKSTLLYIISSLDYASTGVVEIDGKNISEMSVDDIHKFRNENIGFIFQFHYLLPELTALENILLPPRNLNLMDKYEKKAHELLEILNIPHIAQKLPSEISGGEQQRVAIARALIMEPKYIFADEPTGNLDSANGNIVMNILKETNKRDGTTIALVTHDPDFAAMAEREIFLVDGRVSDSYT
jgi:ABC-type lipoprotein export system ATPase subunit